MAEEQKPVVEVPEATVAEPIVAAEAAPVVEPVEETKPAEATETDAAKVDDKKKEVEPIEEGHLGYKAQSASFPKNLIPSKEFFFFGSDAVEPKDLVHYQKAEKSTETAHENLAWASHTGKGLLFHGDKKAPAGVINLSHASDPELDGSNKFHFTAKGHKHSFKASSAAERDSWVAQLKIKIVEAKELAATVVESEVYKNTLETLKPAPVPAKEDKAVEEEVKAEEPAAEEAVKEGEAAKEEAKEEDVKPRSTSRKRASFFNFGAKKDEKKEERKSEEVAAVEPATAAEETVAADPVVAAAADDKPAEEVLPAESPKEKPVVSKRNSFFGGVFSKKEKKPVEATKPAEEVAETAEGEVATDATAPVIPPVESTTPLAVDVSSPATVPTETIETPAVNGEVKKDVKEKRKSSLPFAFGKRDKSPVPADGEEKTNKSAFSKLRATIKGKSSKAEEKPIEEATKEEAVAGEAAATEAAPAAEVSATEPEIENKPENVASSTPAVTATA